MEKYEVLGVSPIHKRGVVTIPKEVREKLDVKEGDFLKYLLTDDGKVLLIKEVFDIDEALRQLSELLPPEQFNNISKEDFLSFIEKASYKLNDSCND